MSNLADLFFEVAAQRGDTTALIEGDGAKVPFTALARQARGFAGHLHAKGIRRGDRLLVAMGVSGDLYATLAALWQIGAVAVFPEPALGLAGLRHAVETAKPKAVITTWPYTLIRALPWLWGLPGFSPRRSGPDAPAIEVTPDDPALISFTSGTTGAPKGISRSQGFLMAQRAAVAPLLASEEDDVDLVAFPVFTLINLAAGRTSVLPNWTLSKQAAVTPQALARWIARSGATRALLPPALAEKLLLADPGGLHTVFTGGGPVFGNVLSGLPGKGLRTVAVFGSTEAEPIAHLDASDVTAEDHQAMASGAGLLAGHPVPEVELRLEDSEIWVTGDHVNKGYLDPSRDAEAKVPDGDGVIWHRTGDAGRLDDQGRLWLLGRTGSILEGPNGPMHPFAVEAAARTWPGITGAALIQLGALPVLAVTGQADHLESWQQSARDLGIAQVTLLKSLPMDKRHNSKIDRQALMSMMR